MVYNVYTNNLIQMLIIVIIHIKDSHLHHSFGLLQILSGLLSTRQRRSVTRRRSLSNRLCTSMSVHRCHDDMPLHMHQPRKCRINCLYCYACTHTHTEEHMDQLPLSNTHKYNYYKVAHKITNQYTLLSSR